MADKASQLVLNALTRAAAAGAGVPLHGSKSSPGLFPTTAVGKQAAQRCRDEGYLGPAAAEPAAPPRARPTSAVELCTITEKGLAYLLSQVSPRQVLEDFVRVLEAREAQVQQLLALARRMQADVQALRASAEQVLGHACQSPDHPASCPPSGDLNARFRDFIQDQPAPAPQAVSPNTVDALLGHLERWAASGATEDCPLPELFRQACAADPTLTIGQFHDALRRLHDAGSVYLHPWTGPLYDLPEPPHALLVGHEIAYYASPRFGRREAEG